jgi:hypothetical protein
MFRNLVTPLSAANTQSALSARFELLDTPICDARNERAALKKP